MKLFCVALLISLSALAGTQTPAQRSYAAYAAYVECTRAASDQTSCEGAYRELNAAIADETAVNATPQKAQAPAPSIMFIGVGGGYNRYVTPATFATTVDFGVKLSSSNFWSLSTLVLQGNAATVRSGLAYPIKCAGALCVVATMDGGVTTTQTTTVTAAGTTTQTGSPMLAVGNLALGNVGGGALLMFDLGRMTKRLTNIRAVVGFREAAVAGTSVAPELVFKLSYALK